MLASRVALILVAVGLPHAPTPATPWLAADESHAVQCPSGGRQKVQAMLEAVGDSGDVPAFSLVVDAAEAADVLWEVELVSNDGELVAATPSEPQGEEAGKPVRSRGRR